MTTTPMLLVIGAVLLLAIGVQIVATRTRIPTISLLLLLGVLLGPAALDVLPVDSETWFEGAAAIALTMIGFLLGGEFDAVAFKRRGRRAVVLSLGLSVGTAILVALTVGLAGFGWTLALLLGGIAPATDPAATVAVLDELGKDDDLATDLRSIVALDDVWGVLIYAIMVAGAELVDTGQLDGGMLLEAGRELGGSLLVGALLGALAAPLTGRLGAGRPTTLEALGLVMVCAGLCEMLGLSTLLASVAMGAALTNLTREHEHPFREVENLEWPFLVVFFVLAGAHMEPRALLGVGGLAVAYVAARAAGRFGGIALGALPLGDRSKRTLLWTPLSLMPQAGVALGLALSAASRFEVEGPTLLTVVVGTTLIFEVLGPPIARIAILRARASD